MNWTRLSKLLMGLGAAAALAAPSVAAAGPTVKLGVLTCKQVDQKNWIVYAKRDFDCRFRSATGSPEQLYRGDIRRYGVNLKLNQGAKLAWAVFAPTFRENEAALDGVYVGAGVDVALAYGVGGRALIGGFNNSLNLQPISFSGEKGFGGSAGVDGLRLRRVE